MKEEVQKNPERNDNTQENKEADNQKKTDGDLKNKTENIISNEDKIIELEEKLVRSLAEMENQRRRFEKEKEDAYEFGGFIFAKESLSIIDNLDRAKTSIQNDETFKKNKDLNKILENFEIIQKDLLSVFKKNSIEQINCINKKFDPNYHQAMLAIESENKEPGIIIQEIQKGFTMKGRLLRPSLVGVTKNKSKQSDIEDKKSKKDHENKENNENKK